MNRPFPALFFFLLFFSLQTQAAFVGIDRIIAIVDDAVITQTDFDEARSRLLKNMKEQGQPAPDEKGLIKLVMDNLILEKLQMQMATRAGVNISDEHLTQSLQSLAHKKGFSSLEAMIADLEENGESYLTLRNQVRKELSIQQVQQSYLRNKIRISDKAINEYLNSYEGKARIQSRFTLSHLFIRLGDKDPAKNAKAKATLESIANDIRLGKRAYSDFSTPQMINGFEVQHGDLGERSQEELPTLFADIIPQMQPGELSEPVKSGAGWHIVRLDDLGGAAKIIHQVHARHILVKLSEVRTDKQAKKLINDLYKRLKKGEDFSLLAKEYSEDPGSALQGGDLDWAEPAKYTGKFRDTLLALKNNDISKPFKTEFGWHIAQKLGERDHNVTEELRKNQAFQTLYHRKAVEEIDAWLNQIRGDAFIEIKDPAYDPDQL